MELDLTKTHTLLVAYESIPKVTSFLRDRYFPTVPELDIFNTDDVLVDYKDNGRKTAPFVSPIIGGKVMTRQGFHTERFTPSLIAPKRVLSVDDLKKRGFGESVFSGVDPAQRKVLLAMRDLKELDEMTTRTEENMAAETLINSKCVMKTITDENGTTENNEIKFYDGDVNPYQYIPATGWDAGGTILDDLNAMIDMLTLKGLPATEIVVGANVASALVKDEETQKMLHNTRMNMGTIDPKELPSGARYIGDLNVYGKIIAVIAYTEVYENDAGEIVPYIPKDTIIMSAPASGRGLYGAVTQLELDNEFHTHKGRRVPKYVPDLSKNTRSMMLSSCPVFIPKNKGAWVSAKVTSL